MNNLILFILLTLNASHAAYAQDKEPGKANKSTLEFVEAFKTDNLVYMNAHRIEFFSEMAKGQHPKATVVACSDSRIHTQMFDQTPEGELYMVRNLGNQLSTSEGSVEYGVNLLQTPVLMILGHSRCGVIAAVTGGYAKESEVLKRELDTISISKSLTNLEGVKANIHNQVSAAMLKFEEKIKANQLVIIGAIADIADDLHQGAGKLHLINVNGETDPVKLANLEGLLNKTKLLPEALPKKK